MGARPLPHRFGDQHHTAIAVWPDVGKDHTAYPTASRKLKSKLNLWSGSADEVPDPSIKSDRRIPMAVTTPILSLAVEDNINTTGDILPSGNDFNVETEQQILALTDGTLLAVYRVGDGVFFQQTDRLGNAIGTEGQFATPDFLATGDFEIIAVENGDVVLAFEAEDNVVPTITVQSFSINNGVATATGDVAHSFEAEVIGPDAGNLRHVSLAGATTSDVVLQSLTTAVDGTQNLTTFTDLDGTSPQSSETAVPFNQGLSTLESDILANGNIVTTVASFGAAGSNFAALDFFITAPNGTPIFYGQTTELPNDRAIGKGAVIALADGGFAITFAANNGTGLYGYPLTDFRVVTNIGININDGITANDDVVLNNSTSANHHVFGN
jgi:hypothetical protein